MNRAVEWSAKLYRVLVNAYPDGFTEDYADEMVWCFEDMCSMTLQKNGFPGLVMLWLKTLPDWCITVTREHLLNFGYHGATRMDHTEFNTQLTSTLALFTRALRDGYNVKQAFEIIVQHAPAPTKGIFQHLLDDVESGTSWLDAFERISGDMKSGHFDKAMMAMRQQMAEGGNLADRLDEVNRELYKDLGDTGWAKAVDLDDGYDMNEHYPLN